MKKLALLMIIGAMMFAFSGVQKANAITAGEPGEALLVPYALYSTVDSVNTLVGITVPSVLGADVPILAAAVAGGAAFAGAPVTSGPALGAGIIQDIPLPGVNLNPINAPAPQPSIHWYFFDDVSDHVLDNTIPATRDDFIPFDWGGQVVAAGYQAKCDGVNGYLVFSNVVATGGGAAVFAMFGDAVLIQGNWQSAAYIPVLPMADGADAVPLVAGVNEVNYAAGIPVNVSPLSAGIPMDNDDALINAAQHMDMRYFLDPPLNGGTDLVVWFDGTCLGGAACCDRTALAIEVFATDETHGSAAIDLGLEMNVVDASTLPWTIHTDADMNGALTDQGFIFLTIPELPALCGNCDAAAADGPDSAAVAFSLIYFGGANALQVQTILAHERGLW